MKKMLATHLPMVSLLAMLILVSNTAQAYIDPGAGSVLLQVLLGGFAGAFVIGRLFWRSIVATVTRPFARFRKTNNESLTDNMNTSELRHADVKE